MNGRIAVNVMRNSSKNEHETVANPHTYKDKNMIDLTDFEVLVSSKPKPHTITFNKSGNVTFSKELSEDISHHTASTTTGFRLHYHEAEKKLFLEFVDGDDGLLINVNSHGQKYVKAKDYLTGTRFLKIKGKKFGFNAIELHETGILVDLRKKSVQSGQRSSTKKKVDNDKPKTLEEQIDENAEKLVGTLGLDAITVEENLRQAEQKIRAEEKRINEIEQEIEDIAETDEKGITADERLRENLTNFVSENFPTDDAPEEENDSQKTVDTKTVQDLSRLYENKEK
ncbi:TPA: hypothetical protein EYN65_16440 [Candidatus Poribacteria bacterium]|nr:hypothetical protein [Candidatus Poribacteria bacterium]